MNPTAPPVKRGREGSGTGVIFLHDSLDHFQPIPHGLKGRVIGLRLVGNSEFLHFPICIHRLCDNSVSAFYGCRFIRRRRVGNDELFHHLAVFDHFDPVAGLANDGARIAADKRITPKVFASLDRLEQKRFALPANFVVGGERRFKIGENAACHGNEIPLRRQFQK